MSPVLFLFVFVEYMNTGDCKSRQSEVSYYSPFQPYAQPVHLPLLPHYEIDIPEQEGKLFGGVAATRYETIIVRETVRPVCLFVDGNVPSCDHIHNYYHPKDGMALNARPQMGNDYEPYFVEPSKPDVKIEITEIPSRGAYCTLTGTTTAEPDGGHAAGGDATPPMTGRGGRQLLQNALGAASTAIAAGLVNNVAGLASGAAAGGLLLQQGGNAAGGLAAAVGHGGNRNQVTMYVTRVDKVLDDHVTVTLVPKNCVPAAGQAHALRPCAGEGYRRRHAAYRPHEDYGVDDGGVDRDVVRPQGPGDEPRWPPRPVVVRAADVVSKVDGLVRELVGGARPF